MVSSADRALDEQFRLFQAFLEGILDLTQVDGSFNDMCVPCGEVTMQISRALLVA